MHNNDKLEVRKEIEEDEFLGFLKSDYELNKSRIKRLKIKPIFEIFKDNFGLILFVISGSGAFIQVLELSRIDLSYLRFFSVTQLASDGALVFVTLAVFTVVAYVYYLYVTIRFRIEDKPLNTTDKNKGYVPLFTPLISLIMVTAISFITLSNEISAEELKKTPIFYLILSAVMVALLAYLIKYCKFTRNDINKLENTNKDKKYFTKGLLTYITILSYLFIPIIIIKTLMTSSLVLREPKNFENYHKVGIVIKERHKDDVIKYRVLYFNDKYTFVKLFRVSSNENTIEVYKTDAILFDETVIKIKR